MPLTGMYKRPLSTMPEREFRQWLEANWPANFYNWQYSADRTKIDGTSIATGTVTADFIVASISMTSPTITGGVFKTAESPNERVLINSDGLFYYDSTNTLVWSLEDGQVYSLYQIAYTTHVMSHDGGPVTVITSDLCFTGEGGVDTVGGLACDTTLTIGATALTEAQLITIKTHCGV